MDDEPWADMPARQFNDQYTETDESVLDTHLTFG
jgi:hypothetical protein